MTRVLLGLAIVAVQLAARQEACCRPPDKVAHSPIPPLKQTQPRGATRVARASPVPTGTGLTHERVWKPIPPAASARLFDARLRSQITRSQPRDTGSAHAEDNSAANDGAASKEIWNSSEMLAARNAVMEFCRRSAQTSPAEGEQFLARLSELSPDEMRHWLKRFQTRRMKMTRGRELESMARQLGVEYTLRRQEEMRRSVENIAELRAQAAEPTTEQSPSAPPLEAARYSLHEGGGSIWPPRSYDPFDAVTDPMSPRGYGRRVAAAMSLPGDLPRSDPRNFIRGDEGANFGVSTTSGDAKPPVAPAPPAAPSPPAAPVAPTGDSAVDQ